MALRLGECLLRKRREAKNLSQLELSKRLKSLYGISASDTLISQYERKEKLINPLTNRAICLILECTEADLYEFIDS